MVADEVTAIQAGVFDRRRLSRNHFDAGPAPAGEVKTFKR